MLLRTAALIALVCSVAHAAEPAAPAAAEPTVVQPAMVPQGAFASWKFHHLKNKEGTFQPKTVGRGALSGKAEAVPEAEPAKPKMVPPGALAAAAQAQVDADHRKANGILPIAIQRKGACAVMTKVLDLARFAYMAETEDSKKIPSSRGVLDLVNVICPLVKKKYCGAACSLDCKAVAGNIEKYYDPKYISTYKTPDQTCMGEDGSKVNFAMLSALASVKTLFGMEFCPSGNSTCPKGSVEALEEGNADGSSHTHGDVETEHVGGVDPTQIPGTKPAATKPDAPPGPQDTVVRVDMVPSSTAK